MQPSASRNRRARRLALLGATTLAALVLPGSRPTLAAPPTAEDFQIYYYITDRTGARGRQMSQQDMELFVNQARCECGQQIQTRVQFQGVQDQDQVNVYVGQNCAMAQALGGLGQFSPCAQLASGTPQSFQNSPEYAFDPIFLAYGVSGEQGIASAVPDGTCSGIEGEGGLWMCSGVNNCQMGSFFMEGATNINASGQGIRYDYQPPLSPPRNIEVSSGDSAVSVSWSIDAVPEAGYRVLCADENGNPVNTGINFTPPDETTIVNASIYFTPDNLCPGGVFGPDYVDTTGDGDGDGDGDTGTDTTGTDTTGDGDGDTTGDGDGDGDGDTGTDSTGDCPPQTLGCACSLPDEPCTDVGTGCIDGICEDIACTPGEFGCVCDGGSCTAPSVCDGSWCVLPSDGIYSLDWSYVCSDHLGFNTRNTRIEGLENGKTYQFLVVAYDRAGNFVAAESAVEGKPVPTSGLWEQCEAQGNVCGQGWNCSVTDEPRGWLWGFGGLGLVGLGLLGVTRRRRRRA